ncbi:hypothetical protein [Flavicella marina]|uniref:hypothetical protein n=1 Tax=Flavicella marina TaxID=1475951 RepID=UPI001264B12D|nr:hypothetical protein [Flavicella marina]
MEVKSKSAYIISKPLQYINATNIIDDCYKDCYIIDSFSDSFSFYNHIKSKSSIWSNVLFRKNRYFALFTVIKRQKSYVKLFLDSDFGILYYIMFWFLTKRIKIYTYEEGYGSYRYINDRSSIVSEIKYFIYSKLGCENWIGGNYFTQGAYLYYPSLFKELIDVPENYQVLTFRQTFQRHMQELTDIKFLMSFNNFDFSQERVLLYLTSHKINNKINEVIKQYPKYIKIIKPHPHIDEQDNMFDVFDIKIKSCIPAEIVINELLNNGKKLLIIHENSSSLLSFTSTDIQEINIANPISNVYESLIGLIRKSYK